MGWGWPFGNKREPADRRVWNDDWLVGDIAECIIGPDSSLWSSACEPWYRPQFRQQFHVVGFSDDVAAGREGLFYFLILDGWPVALPTQAFRKVRPVATEQSSIVEQILTVKPGADRARERA